MSVLVTGATGAVGTALLERLASADLNVRALTRDTTKARFPEKIVPVSGDMLDVASMSAALEGVNTLFLLNAVAADELTQAILTLNLARDAGVQSVVYFSVFNSESFTNVPHFSAKYAVERMLAASQFKATILRPSCFMQNDAMFKDTLLEHGVYPLPIGEAGVSMVDVCDIADIASRAIVEREGNLDATRADIINVVGPHTLTAPGIAAIWSGLLRKPVSCAGNPRTFEQMIGAHAPSWMAMDMRLMLERFGADGMRGNDLDVERMRELLGKPPRAYADFALETIAGWNSQ